MFFRKLTINLFTLPIFRRPIKSRNVIFFKFEIRFKLQRSVEQELETRYSRNNKAELFRQ